MPNSTERGAGEFAKRVDAFETAVALTAGLGASTRNIDNESQARTALFEYVSRLHAEVAKVCAEMDSYESSVHPSALLREYLKNWSARLRAAGAK